MADHQRQVAVPIDAPSFSLRRTGILRNPFEDQVLLRFSRYLGEGNFDDLGQSLASDSCTNFRGLFGALPAQVQRTAHSQFVLTRLGYQNLSKAAGVGKHLLNRGVRLTRQPTDCSIDL